MHSLFSMVPDRRGSVAIITALSITLLLSVSGAAIDFGRYQLVKSRVQEAATAAAVAVAAMPEKKPNGDPYSAADKRQTIERYFALNYPANYMGVAIAPSAIGASFGDTTVIDLANVQIPTLFLPVIGIDNFSMNTKVAVQSTVSSTSTPYDIILAFDNSGSMKYSLDADAVQKGKTTRLEAFQRSAKRMVNNFLSPNQSDSQIAAISWSRFKGKDSPKHFKCNAAGVGLHAVQDFTSNKAAIDALINGMDGNGCGTNSTYGLNRALTMAPQFRRGSVHAVVLLTDGQNNYASWNTASRARCKTLKDMNPQTLVYTIAFGPASRNNRTVRNFLSDCASGDVRVGNTIKNEGTYFFAAPDEAALDAAFSTIAKSIKKIKITQ